MLIRTHYIMWKFIFIQLVVIVFSTIVPINASEECGRLCQLSNFGRNQLDRWRNVSGNVSQPPVVFRLYTNRNTNNPQTYYRGVEMFSNIDSRKQIKVIIHGWRGDNNSTFISTMIRVLDTLDINMISVDWSGLGSMSRIYPTVRNRVGEAGNEVAHFLDRLSLDRRINLRNIHMIGYSLGAHIAGIAGRSVTRGRIGRITGLDPAGPLFSVEDVNGRLSTDSALFVDVIHTSTMGFMVPIGHADFFPNGGRSAQPGCGNDLTRSCSHRRSYLVYVESMLNPQAFPARQCLDWETYKRNGCNSQNTVFMGEQTPSRARGVFFLSTNPNTPFGRGRQIRRNFI